MIGVEACVIERINRLKQLTVDVKAGRAVRHYKLVKSDRPEDLVFQSVRTGAPMRDNNILSRHIGGNPNCATAVRTHADTLNDAIQNLG